MITLTPIPGHSFTKTPYLDLLDEILAIPGWEAERLRDSAGGRPIYGFKMGDFTKPTIFVEANIHGGHEWRTVHWTSQFMRHLNNPTGLADDVQEFMREMKAKYSFYFIPAMNPDGYIENTYKNGAGVNLNRNFDYSFTNGPSDPAHEQYRGPAPFSEPETQNARDAILEHEAVSMLDLHTWSATTQGFAIPEPIAPEHRPYAETYFESVKASIGMAPDDVASYLPTANQGLSKNWGGEQVSSIGARCFAVTMESGGGWPEERQSMVGQTAIMYQFAVVDQFVTDQRFRAQRPAELIEWGPFMTGEGAARVVSVDAYRGGELTPIWRP